jgi:PAS domain S-box-containing protein
MKKIKRPESLVFIVLGVLSLLTLLYSNNSWVELIKNHQTHIHNTSRAQVNITNAYLWVEENLSGDGSINIGRDVLRNIDSTDSILKQLLNGVIDNQESTLTTISNTKYRQNIEQVIFNLAKFKSIALQRLKNRNNDSAGSQLDKDFDAVHTEISILLRDINGELLNNINEGINNQEIKYYLVSLVWLISILLFIFKLEITSKKKNSLSEGLTQFIDTANAPIFGIDNNGKVNEWNQKSAEITGFHADEVLGKNLVEEFITPDYRESVNEVLQKALKGDETSNYEFPLYTKDNDLVMVLLNATTRRDVKGAVVGVVGVGQDITELDSYRSKVKERTRELDTIFTLSPDGFVLANSDNNIVFINTALLKMTGFKEDAFIGKSAQVFNESMASLYDMERMENTSVIGNEDGEHIIYLSKPTLCVLNCNQRTMYGLTGEKDGQVLYIRDVTHEKEVDNMKSEFLSTAAHELRTPLASIYGFSELLLNRDYDKKMTHEMIETIHRQSLNLKHLLDELLDLSRIEARAAKDFYMVSDSLEEIVKQSCVEAEGAFNGRKVEIELLENWPVLSFDIEKMRQVFRNLLSNGFKYSPKSEKVLLKTSERENKEKRQFGVSIIDKGIGMTPQELSRLGERFYRADDSGSVPGSGLGVSLVKKIVSIHGGDIDFISTKGNGMTVTVWLPI